MVHFMFRHVKFLWSKYKKTKRYEAFNKWNEKKQNKDNNLGYHGNHIICSTFNIVFMFQWSESLIMT